MKKIVIALGGNALGENLEEQKKAVKITAKAIAELVIKGHQVIVTHGNGPQVGMINNAFEIASRSDPKIAMLPMAVCVALSQGYIGADLQNALREELLIRGINKTVSTLITQVIVDEHDPAFLHPTKPIGSFFSQQEAEQLTAQGHTMMEDAGRGYRRVVASPKPIDIVEKDAALALLNAGQLVITVGGGGIPVIQKGKQLLGVEAVIDKDWASAKLAEMIDADMLIILTAVEKVAINFGKPNEQWLDHITIDEANQFIEEGHFAKGSMLPKVEAALAFAKSKSGRQALITVLEKAQLGIEGKTGTIISG